MNMMLWIGTFVLLLISLIKSKDKTLQAMKIATKKFTHILSVFILVMIAFAIIVAYIPTEIFQHYIGTESGMKGILIALGLGSISVMPGFAAFPLCAVLKTQGIPYYILAAFSLTLMNVGIVTFPIERKYLGIRIAIIRNVMALFISIVIVLVVKIIFGE